MYEEGQETCKIRLLASRSCLNVARSKFINANSAVVVCEYSSGNQTANICYGGDATYETFSYINRAMDSPRAAEAGLYQNLEKNKCNILITPHHGALKTACRGQNISSRTKLNIQLQAAEQFSDHICACCIFTSAYYQSYHWHPCRDVLKLFGKYVPASQNAHRMSYYQMSLNGEIPRPDCTRDLISCAESAESYVSCCFSGDFYLAGAAKGRMDADETLMDILNSRNLDELCYDFICEIRPGPACSYQIVAV